MQTKIELLSDRIRFLIEEVNELRAQNEELQAQLIAKENEAGLTKTETQEALDRLDALIQTIEQATITTNTPSTTF